MRSVSWSGHWEMMCWKNSLNEGTINFNAEVAGEKDAPSRRFKAFDQIAAVKIGKAVTNILQIGSLAIQNICLIKEQHRINHGSNYEDMNQVFIGFPDILGNYISHLHSLQHHPPQAARMIQDQTGQSIPALKLWDTAARFHFLQDPDWSHTMISRFSGR
jgi:hypothetical protein